LQGVVAEGAGPAELWVFCSRGGQYKRAVVWGRGAVVSPRPEALAAAVLVRNMATAGQCSVAEQLVLYFGVGLL
jgi:hypothetical protein